MGLLRVNHKTKETFPMNSAYTKCTSVLSTSLALLLLLAVSRA